MIERLPKNGGMLAVRCLTATSVPVTIHLRVGEKADLFIAHEFLGGFYIPPPETPKLIIDGGANIGLFLVRASAAFPSTPIICYEPDAKNLEMLRLNASRNGLKPDIRPLRLWNRSMSGCYHPKTAYDGYISEEPSSYPVTCEVPPPSKKTPG